MLKCDKPPQVIKAQNSSEEKGEGVQQACGIK